MKNKNNFKKILIALLCIFLSAGSIIYYNRHSISKKYAVYEKIDAIFSNWYGDDTPGAAVIIIKDGKILLKKGYGLSDLETETAITPDTAFLLCSVTKQFTAMAIMILEERGALSYEDQLTKYFPDFPDYAENITIRHLLYHTSGLPEYDGLLLAKGLIDYDWPRSADSKPSDFEPTSEDIVELLSKVEQPRFISGEKYEYCNSGYVILAQIVELVSNKSFSDFLNENIFTPLGMNRSILYDHTSPLIENVATSYLFSDDKYTEIDYAPQNYVYGNSNIYTTVEDMYKWDQALYSEKLVKQTTINEAFTAGETNKGEYIDYGFGWRIEEKNGYKTISHGGYWLGYRTGILRVPEKKATIVILANTSRVSMRKWMDDILKIVLE